MAHMDSRKRPYSDEEDSITAKKRVLTGPNGTPHVNGVSEQEEPTENDNLELFRKEAIFRRMRHYSREYQRSQNRITELERRKHTCEAGLTAMSACWNQLVQTIRLLVKTEDLTEVDDDIFDLAMHIPDETSDFTQALEDNMSITKTLVNKLVKAGGDLKSILYPDSAYEACEKATAECIGLRSQINVMRAKLRESEGQKDEYYAALIAAESRLDRSRSKTVLTVESRMVETKQPTEAASEESEQKPSSPPAPNSPTHSNGIIDPVELDVLQELVSNRDAKIVELEKEAALLRDEKTILESELRSPSHEKIQENPHYKALLDHAAFLQATVNDSRLQIARLVDETNSLRTSRRDWEEGILAATGQANQELKTMLAKRDAENARLRDQREQQAAELNERKLKDNVKCTSSQELKALAHSRSERISVLESELRRLKAQLAANANNEDLMLFFAGGNIEEAAYVESLKNRLGAAENRAAAFERTLSIFQDDHPNVVTHMKSEADALQELAEVKAELVKYKAIYGDPSTLSPDASKLIERLNQKEDEIQRLSLLDMQRTQAETSLYAELDKLSAGWESLDRQVKNKVFDLSAMEDRLMKSGLDRAKSENKFYAAMRDKEAVETERKNLVRNMEKQVKLVDRLVDTEKNLSGQLITLEKELVTLKTISNTYKEKMEDLSEEVNQWTARADAEKRKAKEMRARLDSREKDHDAKKEEVKKLEDELVRRKKGLEQRAKEASSVQSVSLPEKQLMQLLKCSCHRNFRNSIITKCMHTFCKECLDERILTRQRKCPACGLPFSQSEVLNGMFFQ